MKSALYIIAVMLIAQVLWADDILPVEAGELDKVTLQLKWQHQFQFAGYYAAIEKGFYRNAGLDVELVESTDAIESTRKVISGEIEFGIAMADLVLHRCQGEPVVALATIYQHSPLVILVKKESGIDSIHDLHGKRLMLEAHADELTAYLKSEGLSLSQLNLMPHSYSPSALIEGSVDAISAYSTDEPYVLKERNIDYIVFSPRASGIDFYGDTLFTTEKQVREHPARVRAFLSASIQGWEYAMRHPDEIIDLILTRYSQRHTREHLFFEAEMSKRLILSDVVELGYMNPGRWKNIAEVYSDLEMIPANYSLSGFLYEKNPKKDYTWLYISLTIMVLIAMITFTVSARFYRLNTKLSKEIVRRQTTEQQLRESELEKSILLGNLPGMAYRCSPNDLWSLEFISEGCRELTGFTAEELFTEKITYQRIIFKEDLESQMSSVEKALTEKQPFRLIYRIKTRTNETKWVWEQGQGFYNEQGNLDYIEGFITDISEQKKLEAERETLIQNLQSAIKEIKVLRGILPICASCKKIRDDKGYWSQLEVYIRDHSEADFSHGLCPECAQKLYSDFMENRK